MPHKAGKMKRVKCLQTAHDRLQEIFTKWADLDLVVPMGVVDELLKFATEIREAITKQRK